MCEKTILHSIALMPLYFSDQEQSTSIVFAFLIFRRSFKLNTDFISEMNRIPGALPFSFSGVLQKYYTVMNPCQ